MNDFLSILINKIHKCEIDSDNESSCNNLEEIAEVIKMLASLGKNAHALLEVGRLRDELELAQLGFKKLNCWDGVYNNRHMAQYVSMPVPMYTRVHFNSDHVFIDGEVDSESIPYDYPDFYNKALNMIKQCENESRLFDRSTL